MQGQDIKVLYFAAMRSHTTLYQDEFKFEDRSQITVDNIKKAISEKHPQVADLLESCMVAVDGEYLFDTEEPIDVSAKTEIAVIPPISGG